MVEGGGEAHAAKAAPAKAAAPAATPKTTSAAPAKPAAPSAAPSSEHKTGAQPNRQLFKRSTYAGVKDTGPVAGETFEQKVARLKTLSAAAKQRAEEGGAPTAPAAPASVRSEPASASEPAPTPVASASVPQEASAPANMAVPATAHKPTGNADRTLMKRSTYCGVVDTGPVQGETFEQKVARLAAVSAAAKQRSEESGGI
jgi:hypothetical protein